MEVDFFFSVLGSFKNQFARKKKSQVERKASVLFLKGSKNDDRVLTACDRA